jgi:hypothetical protein
MGIIILAPWCMHHWASIITNASIHMHHSIVHGTFYHRVAPALQSCIPGVHHYPSHQAFALWVNHFIFIPWYGGIVLA